MRVYNNRGWLLVAPAGLIIFCIGIVPLVTIFNYSFFDIFILKQAYWVGTQWYEEIFGSSRFGLSLARSLLFSAIVLSVQIPLGIALALLLQRAGRLRTGMLMLFAVPLVVPWNMIPVLWLSLVDAHTGPVGRALAWLGAGFDYKFNALHTWTLIVVMDTWHWLGLVIILTYAGLSGIPGPYYQAAAIDGASRWAVFRYIELPKIGGVLSIALLLRFVDSFMIYTEAFTINAGGPNNATTFLSLDLGEDIKAYNYGSAAARSIVYFLIILTIAWAFRTATERRRAFSGEVRA
ncbi:carbohydrate ABC transporter permease [Oryzibacter oryziterrae]|uniref:carbohydrate ABC transporter permease n=1 Tax=Oryzibacter oryziterrae TaxID=2766474 RepID=UPI001F2B0921|nr:sugar ABC transporter permease [Oryzibacter oryziterrae]